MKAFFVRWRSVRMHSEQEIFADSESGAAIFAAVEAADGLAVWEAGTIWKCPGCGDRTLRIEEFLEGLRRAELHLRREMENSGQAEGIGSSARLAALLWIHETSLKMLGCERDRVYIKDEDGRCAFENETYFSRV